MFTSSVPLMIPASLGQPISIDIEFVDPDTEIADLVLTASVKDETNEEQLSQTILTLQQRVLGKTVEFLLRTW